LHAVLPAEHRMPNCPHPEPGETVAAAGGGRTMSAPAAAPAGLTEQQQAALDARDVSVSLSAGAGCGKTFVLTERFLSHVDPTQVERAELDEIVAITFTDAAAREMRDRIRRRCFQRLQ